tara:strand:- start:47561 stop:49783 length:2223 start_codon:yes stop_codon:yes gene_type:complete
MKRIFTLLATVFTAVSLYGQSYPLVSIKQINAPIDLAACNDSSSYLGDTVRFRAHVVTDGGLSEVASGSVQGGNRPFIYMIDTASNGVVDSLSGMEVMGVYSDASGNLQPIPGFTALFQGDKVEVTGIVQQFDGNTQFTTLDVNSVTLLTSGDLAPSAFVPKQLTVGDFNDNNRVNIVTTGEYWQNGFVELQNVTVVQVTPFSGSRVSFDIQDANGNVLNVSDRFLAQRTPSHTTVNPNTPSTTGTGSFVAPSVGTFYSSIKGIVRHSANGCTGGTGRGYELNPFDDSHYQVGASAPSITNVLNFPPIVSSADSVLVSADVVDADGTIDTLEIYWSANSSMMSGSFSSANMNLVSGSTYEFYIPAQPDGTLVRYWIRAVDNDGSAVTFPVSPSSQVNPYFNHYSVRDNGLKIFDLQYSGNGTGESVFVGQTVTVTGYVTSARRDCDLEYVYMQDPSDSIFAGIALIPNQDLDNVYRDQMLSVTGQIQETFGVTYLNVDSYVGLAGSMTIMPTPIDPSDANLDMEMYEGMLVSYQNPNGGKVYITDENAGFAEYRIGTDPSFGPSQSSRVLAGRQSGGSATSSLHVSLISDSSYVTNDGTLQVPAVITNTSMNMDAMHGILWYSFGNYKLLPRNNFDIVGLNVAIDTTGCNVPTNVSLNEVATADLAIFPNPAQNLLNIISANGENVQAALYDMNGRLVSTSAASNRIEMDLSAIAAGVYVLQVKDANASLLSTERIVISK